LFRRRCTARSGVLASVIQPAKQTLKATKEI
jgi:hypothetical protein